MGINSLVAVDSNTDKDIRTLNLKDTIYKFSGPQYVGNIRANTFGDVGSVKFDVVKINAPSYTRIENEAPCSLGGDNNGDYIGMAFASKLIITATPYSKDNLKGIKGNSLTIELTVLYDTTPGEIVAFRAYNVLTSDFRILKPVDTIYTDDNFQIRADVQDPVRSVNFRIDNFYHSTENQYPFTVNYNFNKKDTFTISATPYSEQFESGFKGATKTLQLTVVSRNSRNALSGDSFGNGQAISIYPNPVKDILTVSTGSTIQESIQILDEKGKEIDCMHPTQSENPVNVGHLNDGVYYLMIGSGSERNIKKFIKKN